MYKRNPGRFTEKIKLLEPVAHTRDELGGLAPTTYEPVLEVYAMCELKSQSKQQIIGDYVTVDTRYFVVRDITKLVPGINTKYRIEYNGFTYTINNVELIRDSKPFFVQLTATAINGSGGII